MKHYLLNLTWRCPNRCSYCWMQNSVGQRPELLRVPERTLDEWSAAIERDPPELIDIAGGESLLVPWLPALIQQHPGVRFGLSSNIMPHRALRRLMMLPPENLVSLAISFHPGTARRLAGYEQQWLKDVEWLTGRGVSLIINIVDFSDNVERTRHIPLWLRERGITYSISPYVEVKGLGEKLARGLNCRGGIDHLNIAPDGTAWPCLTALRSPYWRELSLGNWIDGTIDLSRRVQPCYLNCADYYIHRVRHHAGDMWGVNAEPASGGVESKELTHA